MEVHSIFAGFQDSSNAPVTPLRHHHFPTSASQRRTTVQVNGQLWNPHTRSGNPSGFRVSTTAWRLNHSAGHGQGKMLHRAQGRSRTRWISLDEQIQRLSRAPDFSSTMQAPIYSTPCRIYSNPLTLNCCLI